MMIIETPEAKNQRLHTLIKSDPHRARRELDPAYFFQEHLKIYAKSGELVPLRMNSVQMAIYEVIKEKWSSRQPVRLVILKARRFGVSTFSLALALHTSIYGPGGESMIESHDLKSANYLFGILQNMYYWLECPEKPLPSSNSNGVLHFRHPHGGKITVETGKKKESGRAFQLKVFHGSEVAFWDNPDTAMLGVEQALSDQDVNSMSILESTANGVGNWFYNKYTRAKEGKAGDYVALFYPWFCFDEYRRNPGMFDESDLSQRERTTMDRFSLELDQMAWYRWILDEKCNGDEDKRAQEYPSDDEEAFLATGSCRFKAKTLYSLPIVDSYVEGVLSHELNRHEEIKSVRFERSDGGYLRIWERPEINVPYVIGIDPSDGIGQDATAGVVLNSKTGYQAAELHGQFEPDDELGLVVYLLGMLYNKAYVGIEIPGPGASTVLRVRDIGYPLGRLVHHFASGTKGVSSRTQKLGWRSTEITRELAINSLASGLNNGEILIRSGRLREEMKVFIRHRSGKYAAQEGYHDDLVSALYIATAMLTDPKSKVVVEKKRVEVDWTEPPEERVRRRNAYRRGRNKPVWSSYEPQRG
jgi:hypothetical protein